MRCPILIFSQSDSLIQIVGINSHTERQKTSDSDQLASQKSSDLDLHCLQRQGISGFSRTRVNLYPGLCGFSEVRMFYSFWFLLKHPAINGISLSRKQKHKWSYPGDATIMKQPSQGTQRRRDEEQILTKQMPPMNSTTNKQRTI